MKVFPTQVDGRDEDPSKTLLSAIALALRKSNAVFARGSRLDLGAEGFQASDGTFVETDRVFKTYLTAPITIEQAKHLAQAIARASGAGTHLIWVQLWADDEGSDEIAFFEVLAGRVQRERGS